MADAVVWIVKTGRAVDVAARAVHDWANSKHCDFRGGAGLVSVLCACPRRLRRGVAVARVRRNRRRPGRAVGYAAVALAACAATP